MNRFRFKPFGENNLYRDLKAAERAVLRVMQRKIPGALLSGPSGIGKTRMVETAVRQIGIRTYPFSAGSGPGALEALYQFGRRPDSLMFADDKDQMLRREEILNILKVLLDPLRPRILTHSLKDGTRSFEVRAGIIFCTNLPLDPKSFGSKGPHLEAIKSRASSAVIDISRDRSEAYDYTLDIGAKMLRDRQFTRAQSNDVFEYFASNFYRLPEVSPRMLLAIAALRRDEPQHWREDMDRQLLAEPWGSGVQAEPLVIRVHCKHQQHETPSAQPPNTHAEADPAASGPTITQPVAPDDQKPDRETRRHRWTDSQKKVLIGLFEEDRTRTNRDLASLCTAEFGVTITENSIVGAFYRLGLRRS